MGLLHEPFHNLLIRHPKFAHNWVLMLSKLIRMLFNPFHIDNYEDIIGYATLSKQLAEQQGDES